MTVEKRYLRNNYWWKQAVCFMVAVYLGSGAAIRFRNNVIDDVNPLTLFSERHETMFAKLRECHGRVVFDKRLKLMEIKGSYGAFQDQLSDWKPTIDEETYAIPKSLMNCVRVNVLGKDRRLTQDIVDLLRISWKERENADAAIWRSWVAVAREEAKRFRITHSSDTRICIEVTRFDEEGHAIKEKLRHDLAEALGNDRAEFLFLNYKSFGLNRGMLLGFGTLNYKLTIEKRGSGRKSWALYRPPVSYTGVPSHEIGRFYDNLPPEVKKLVKPEDRGLPMLPGEGFAAGEDGQ